MKSIVYILFMSCLGGCVGYSLQHVHGVVNGNQVHTQYGVLDGNVTYDGLTCFGSCPKANMEIISEPNNGSSGNSSK